VKSLNTSDSSTDTRSFPRLQVVDESKLEPLKLTLYTSNGDFYTETATGEENTPQSDDQDESCSNSEGS
jgi:hypothetical protein